MFLTKDEAKENIERIVFDNTDNEIIFITAHKGIGKTELLQDVCKTLSNDAFIFADGKKIISSASNIKKCFIEGIIVYLSRHNTSNNRRLLCNEIGQKISTSQRITTIARRKINTYWLGSVLCSFPIEKLKEIYFSMAGSTPFVIVSMAVSLTCEEVNYLKELQNDSLGCVGARITFVIGIRATLRNIQVMDKIIKSKENGIWIIPLLPEIMENSTVIDPLSISSIAIKEHGIIKNNQQIQSEMLSDSVYFETYESIRHLCNTPCEPHELFILANQDIRLEDYEHICSICKTLFRVDLPSIENGQVLSYNGMLIWIDVLAYYIALQIGIVEAVNCIQRFFLDIIREVAALGNCTCFDKLSWNSFLKFLKTTSLGRKNALAEGLSNYYADFALLARQQSTKGTCTYRNSIVALDVLERMNLVFSIGNIETILVIYENTQLCFVLDIGIRSIICYLNGNSDCKITCEIETCIRNYLEVCTREAYKWSDITLINGIAQLNSLQIAMRLGIKYRFDIPSGEMGNAGIHEYFKQAIEKYDIKIGDLTMPKHTIFLSYAQKNSIIADSVENSLVDLGYDVKRDIRDVNAWDSLKGFMKTIRKEDYVVFIVSDTYLHRDNCLYEVMQFLKDDSYEKRAFPIAVQFTNDEKRQRTTNNMTVSMFDIDYIAEIVLFWQKRSESLKTRIDQLLPENRGELDMKYREISNMAQNASEFLTKFFGDKLLMTIDYDHSQYSDIAKKVDEKIRHNDEGGLHTI